MERFDYRHSRWISLASTQNFLRAFVVHQEYRKSEVIQKVVRMFAGMQNNSGTWNGRINSYLLINALGHLDMDDAKRQFITSLSRLSHTQNRDGSWGRREKEWKTFFDNPCHEENVCIMNVYFSHEAEVSVAPANRRS